MLPTIEKFALRELLQMAKTIKDSEFLPEILRYYDVMSQPEGVKGSWERKVRPELSGVEVLAMIVGRKIIQVREAMDHKEELISNFEEELWRYRFNKCIREMRDTIREDDILNKDVMLKELAYFYGPKLEYPESTLTFVPTLDIEAQA